MKRLAFAALLALSCDSSSSRLYDNNDLQLATGYNAKEMCSCLFVMQMPVDYCQDWTRASPAVVRFKIDDELKTVESTGLLNWGNRARFVSDQFGCVLDD